MFLIINVKFISFQMYSEHPEFMCCVQRCALHRLDRCNLRDQSLLFISREPNLNPALEVARYMLGHHLNSTVHV